MEYHLINKYDPVGGPKKEWRHTSLNGWPLCAELMLLQLQHQIIHANRKWEAGGRWRLGEEESIVCETVIHAQGHTITHRPIHTCAASVCRGCIIRPVGAGEVCLSRAGRLLLWPQYNMLQPILVYLCLRVQLRGFAAYMQWGMEFWKRLGHIIHTPINHK